MAISVKKDVLWFQISVHNLTRVKIIESTDNLGRVKERGCVVKTTYDKNKSLYYLNDVAIALCLIIVL